MVGERGGHLDLIGVEVISFVDKYVLLSPHSHAKKSAPEFRKGRGRIILQPSWSKSSPHPSWLLQEDAEAALSKRLVVSCQAAPEASTNHNHRRYFPEGIRSTNLFN